MRRIVFIEPKAPDLHIFSQFHLPRLGIFILGTIMQNRGWEVEIIVEELHKIDFEKIKNADLVGISTITSTAPRAYAIADKVREMGIPVIMGGPHVTYLTDEALEHADYVIRGEGERALSEFIDAWESGEDFTGISNLSYTKNGKTINNPIRPFTKDLENLPYPQYDMLMRHIPVFGGKNIIPVQTSRGCPFDCSFCSVTGMFGKRFRYRSTENIMEELRQYNDRKNFLFIYDDNFTHNRQRAKELLTKMIEEKLEFKWSTQVRVDITRDLELVKLMKQAGCHTLFIGLESVNPESLKSMKKNQTREEIAVAVKVLKKHRIHVHGMFVYGFDEDDWNTVRQTVKFARKAGLTSTQFLILTPLPGSEIYERLKSEDRIKFEDWTLYDAHHAVFQPSKFTLFDLQKAQMFSHKKFYSLVQMVKKFIEGKWIDLGLAHYARNLNRMWKKRNRKFLKVIDLLRPNRDADITMDYRVQIHLEDETKAA